MLAMDVNDNAGCLNGRGAYKSIASRLAPTLFCGATGWTATVTRSRMRERRIRGNGHDDEPACRCTRPRIADRPSRNGALRGGPRPGL
ncbi:hypothetical protein C1X65_13140 [Pseudomonas sp. FW305-70]|nr:hypothetical protein C1X65_13140 [Pseudomonas sp. FW305-70]